MAKKRERLEVIYDILTSVRDAKNQIKPTRLLYSSNLSPQMFKGYIDELLKSKILEETQGKDKKKCYSLTDKGYKYIQRYEVFTDFVDSMGL